MAEITSSGFETTTYNEELDNLLNRASSTEYFGENFPTDPTSVMYILTGIFSGAIKDQVDLIEALASQMDRDEAEGKNLDRLAAYTRLVRLSETASRGNLLFTGLVGTTVPLGTTVRTSGGNTVATNSANTLSQFTCNKATISINSVVSNHLYTISIKGLSIVYTSDASATLTEITQGLISAIQSYGSDIFTAEDYTSDGVIIVYSYSESNTLSIVLSNEMSFVDVSMLINATASLVGSVPYFANTLTMLVDTVAGITSVTNPSDFNLGRSKETDAELRQRMANRTQSFATATKPSVESNVAAVSGVDSVLVVENTDMVEDSEGRPPKSYQVYVDGGANIDIANVIWETKPAGIETYGDITVIVIDESGSEQAISFSRYSNNYAWVEVTYSINSEESKPNSIAAAIAEAVVDTGNGMYAGEDFERTKFYGNIYSNVSGIYVNQIRIAVTANIGDTPTYQTARIPVNQYTNLVFDSSRVLSILTT